MKSDSYTENIQEKERAIVVCLKLPNVGRATVDDHLKELIFLADTAGSEVIHRVIQEKERIESATFVGSGKADEIAQLAIDEKIDLVIFDDDLSHTQLRNLEKVIKCKIIDRSGLILDIFASRAKTKEAMTQVELAQLQYMLPRLTRQWTHLSKQYGGIGTKGPGETQIETDRRAIRSRIKLLKEKLKLIEKEREVQRKGRKEFIRFALVGYTNVGKSTLMNTLSGADVFVENRLFATLDTTVRTINLNDQKVLISDTVGFIRKLPAHLIASFKSTLAEVVEADILLHIVDVSHPMFEDQIQTVRATIDDLGVNTKLSIMVFNKIDMVKDRTILNELKKKYPDSVAISAARSININALKEKLIEFTNEEYEEKEITTDQSNYKYISRFHDIGEIMETNYHDNQVTVRLRYSKKRIGELKKILSKIEN